MEILFGVAALAVFIVLVLTGLRFAKRMYSAATGSKTTTSTSNVTAQFGNNEGNDNA